MVDVVMKKKYIKKQFIVLIVVSILCVALYFLLVPYYRVDSRISNIKNFSKKSGITPLGWIKVQGTNIDYPIVYYYDVDDIGDPTYNIAWNFSNQKKLASRTVVLSHNMKNVSSNPIIGDKNHERFEQLMAYIYYDFVKENKYIQYTVDGKDYLYKIYGISFQLENDIELGNIKKDKIDDYIKFTKNNSYFDFDVNVNKNDKLITLITCTRFFGDSDYSFVVDARKVRKNEQIKNYTVKEKKNYKKIKKILKGDDKNE